MIDLIIFDLDGVLADTEDIHYTSLCDAIFQLTRTSYDDIYNIIKKDGSTTKEKLSYIQKLYNLSNSIIYDIDVRKQELVTAELRKIKPNNKLRTMLLELGILIPCLAVGSNSRKINVDLTLGSLDITEFFSFILCAEDVEQQKPSSEIFIKIMNYAGASPVSTLILEDSPLGCKAAISSGAHLLKINSCNETNLENITNAINTINSTSNRSPNGWDGISILQCRL